MNIEVYVLALRPVTGMGKLLALADVALTWHELAIEIRGIRVEAVGVAGKGGTKVSMPVDRERRAVLVLPSELADAVAEVVLAAGIDAGILKPRARIDI